MTREYKDQIICRIVSEVWEQAELDNLNIYEGLYVNDKFYEFQERAFELFCFVFNSPK